MGGTPRAGDVMAGESNMAEAVQERATCAEFANEQDGMFEARCGQNERPSLGFRVAKRTFDLVAASAALVILSPLFLAVSIAVKTTSPGPIVFKQERYGRNKQHFTCYKFRSMMVDTPADIPTRMMGERQSVMTPIGATLRKTSIDELPQLVNIVKGEMSVVGPRPMILAEYDQIQARDRYGANDIRPGLTGWAQVNGRDGLTVEEKARFDGEYRWKMSIAMDARVLLQSVVVVLGRFGYAESKKEPEEPEEQFCLYDQVEQADCDKGNSGSL